MTENTALLALPLIMPSQAQKHLTHNEAIKRLDALVQLSVASRSTTAAPTPATEGERYILPAGASGAWAGQAPGTVAIFRNGTWEYETPSEGWLAWVSSESALVVFDGATWEDAVGQPQLQNLPQVGINTTADSTNRLAVSAPMTLLSHAGQGHQLKINKAGPSDTASLLFQSNWSGRAEMGLAGSNDFSVKVSADGGTFRTGLSVNAATGVVSFPNGVSNVAPTEFGTGPLATAAYVQSRGSDLVSNGTGLLGNGYNHPAGMVFDPVVSPNLPGSFRYSGYASGILSTQEDVAVDPNRSYRTSSYLRQAEAVGNWSSFANGCRHQHYIGLICYDADRNQISAHHHMRFKEGGVDSLTTLAQPLAPGDTVVHLTSAAGWNTSASPSHHRGIIVFGYKNTVGYSYDRYSRHVAFDLFDLGAVNVASKTVTLKAPWPGNLGNPAATNGAWPAGTALANSASGGSFKYCTMGGTVVPQTERWYRAQGFIGGVDRSGTNVTSNFAPGTAYVRVLWLANYSNRVGGFLGIFPETGAAHNVWFAGTSVIQDPLVQAVAVTSGAAAGSYTIKAFAGDPVTGSVTFQNAAPSLSEV